MAIALESILSVLFLQLLPLGNQVRVRLVLTGGPGNGFARLDFMQAIQPLPVLPRRFSLPGTRLDVPSSGEFLSLFK